MYITNKLRSFYRMLPIAPTFLKTIYWYLENKRRLLFKDRVVTKSIKGIKYELYLNQLIDSKIYYEGCFEPDTSACIERLLKSGMVCCDVGANVGCHTLPMARIVGEDGIVIAFEPMEWALKKLKKNIELNNFNNIVIENAAVSDYPTTEKVSFRSSWRLDHKLEENSRNLQDVRFVTLDGYVKSKHIKQIDFIKLDVDGYEYKFLLGAKEVLKKFKPTIIMELGDYTLKRTGDKIEEMIAFLLSLGYEFYSERSMDKFSDMDSILDSIPNRDKLTINVVLLHKEANINA